MIAEVEQYLEMKRKLGFEMCIEGGQLLRFARYTEITGHDDGPLTMELAM